MDKITTTIELQDAICKLESLQIEEKILLKKQVSLTIEQFKPFNLLKNTFHEMSQTETFKENAIETILSMAAGYISKKIITTATHSSAAKILGSIIQMGITSLVSKNSSTIKNNAVQFIQKLVS